jgi:protein-tyrosine phosphatase
MLETKKLLFVCSRNKWRSKTAETIFNKYQNLEVRSAGTSNSTITKITISLIEWADKIYVMEKKHKEIMEHKFGKLDKLVSVLNIPDEYKYMDEELIDELKSVVIIE